MAWYDDPITENDIRKDLKVYYQPDPARYIKPAKSFDEALDDPAGDFRDEIRKENLRRNK